MNCPHCGKEIETQQHRAVESRWAAMTKAERSAEMSRIRRKGIKKHKRTARRSNDELCGASDASASAIGSHPNRKTK